MIAPLVCAAALLLLAPPLDFRRYYDVPEVEAAMRRMAARHLTRARVERMGRSFEGRDILVLVISNPETGPEAEKAAMYIDGNTHGNEIQGTEICLYTANLLLEDYERDSLVKRIVDERVVYIAPTVNPDGRWHFFHAPQTPHSSRWNRRPHDDDGDGLADEDGYDDLDGDGRILNMRKRDPRGEWVTGDDPRTMRQRRPDESGEWTVFGSEGIDNDGDGRINEDNPGGVDLNRNFPTAWLPRHQSWAAGDFPLSEPETRATAEFILARPHIAAIQSYHNAGNMILRPPASGGDENVPRRDLEVYDMLGRRGEKLLPGYRYMQTFKDLYPVRGGFLEWGYVGLGIYAFTNELWSMPADYDGDGRVSEKEQLRWSDEALDGRGFVPWKRFQHPTLGEVEIGGWDPMAPRIPPGWLLEEMCARNARFTLVHADMMPKVVVGPIAVEALGGTTWRVTAELRNDGVFDTVTEMGQRVGVVRPDEATIAGEGVRALAVGTGEGRHGPAFAPAPRDRARDPARLLIPAIPGRNALRVAWIVEGPRGATVEVRLRSVKGGAARGTARLE